MKCLPLLGLDYFNPEHQTKLVVLPDINGIKPKKPSPFDFDEGYLGEIVEFYDNYISRMTNLKGFAINGWSDKDARLLFDSVDRTFQGTGHGNSKNFEIDWLLFNGLSLSVVEVGMRGASSKLKTQKEEANEKSDDLIRIERLISKKVDQVMKSDAIIQHLLEATKQKLASVNYLLVFPDIAIDFVKERIRKMYIKAQNDGREYSLDRLLNSTK